MESLSIEQKDHPDLVNKGPTWFIEDVYKSKEYQEKINHAERSLLIQCNSNMIQQGIAVCERMGPVSKVLMISNRVSCYFDVMSEAYCLLSIFHVLLGKINIWSECIHVHVLKEM